MGDFQQYSEYDRWPIRTPGGDWAMAPEPGMTLGAWKRKRTRDYAGASWHRWIKKVTKGQLSAEDLPEGSMSPWLKEFEVRRMVSI